MPLYPIMGQTNIKSRSVGAGKPLNAVAKSKQPEAFEGEILVDNVDSIRLRRDHASESAGGDDLSFAADAFQQSFDHRHVTVYDTRLDGGDG